MVAADLQPALSDLENVQPAIFLQEVKHQPSKTLCQTHLSKRSVCARYQKPSTACSLVAGGGRTLCHDIGGFCLKRCKMVEDARTAMLVECKLTVDASNRNYEDRVVPCVLKKKNASK
jgi:hypothetical protein